MEHSSHAHPSSGEQNVSAGPQHTSHPQRVAQSPSGSPNQQTRRLQLRNAGFRGPVLPFRRISPLLGASVTGIEPFTRSINNDNAPSSAEKRSLYGEDLPKSPVNILQEIHKMSTRKKRTSPRPGFGVIWEDDTKQDDAGERSWYNGGSSDCSPAPPATTPARKQLREISMNQKTPPPLGSSMPKHVKSRSTNRGKLRSASSETAQYIEHLESELASAHARLDLQPSPKTSKLRAAKIRDLTTENRNLKHENSEWQKNFESRLQEERAKRLDIDMELTSAMRMLEDELETKNARMAELEWELDSMRVRIRDLEGLEAINHNLERRIEALTNLLVQSPTKLELSSASTSPVRADPSKRPLRPKSMLPRLPTSPGAMRTSLPTVAEASLGRSQILGLDGVGSPEEPSRRGSTDSNVQSPAPAQEDPSQFLRRHSGSVEGRSRNSTSFRSGPSSVSKHTSMRSSCSFGPIAWTSPEHESRSAAKQRRMRRFPSGSNALKPLILPSATDVPVLSASTPVFSSPDSTPGQNVSDLSMDLIAISPSMIRNSYPSEQSRRRSSATAAQEQALKALEGKSVDTKHPRSDASESRPTDVREDAMGVDASTADEERWRSRPRSLQKELEEAEMEQCASVQDETWSHNTNLASADNAGTTAALDPTSSRIPLPANQRRQAQDVDTTPRPAQRQPPLNFATSYPAKAPPSTSLTVDHAQGLFSRITEIITQTKQSPAILARRFLAKAWSSGSKRLGGIGWWLLGLLNTTRWCKQERKADIETAEDRPMSNACCGRDASSEINCAGPYGGSFTRYDGPSNRMESWLSPHVSRNIRNHNTSSAPTPQPPRLLCDHCVEPSSRRTLRLWLRFSLTMVLAVGVAVMRGPEYLLPSSDPHDLTHEHHRGDEQEPLLREQRQREPSHRSVQLSEETSQASRGSRSTNGVDSGYGSMAFSERVDRADLRDP